jgi:hypothetical protein
MIGTAMTAVLHGDKSGVTALIEDWKTLFTTMLAKHRS